MSLLRDHECRDCPANEKMCAHHRNKYCKGYAAKTWTILMAKQAAKNTWDGNFRFPRLHWKGRSLKEFSYMELRLIRNHCHAIWEAYHNSRMSLQRQGIILPVWPRKIDDAHNLEVDVIQEMGRRKLKI